MHDPSRRHEREGRCDGREHPGPDSITFTDASRHGRSDGDFGSYSHAFANDCSYGHLDSYDDAFVNDCSDGRRNQHSIATHDCNSRAADRHAKPDAARDIGSVAESYNDSRTDGDARCDDNCFASTGSADSGTGGRRPGLASG